MNSINISQKAKNKHLNFSHYEFIINSLIQFNASHSGKRNIGKTQFIKELASTVGTTVSNVYSVIKDATITIKDTHLKIHYELSAMAAFEKRSKNHKIPNNSKFEKSKEFISLVEQEVKSNRLSSIDETINYLRIHQPDIIKNIVTVSTKTFYSYVHQGRTSIKPIDLPRMVRRKTKKNWKSYIPKRQKGTSITERPEYIKDREEFGHWEGDLVTGPRDGQNGAYLTLIERKTRFYYMIPISAKSSKQVYMQINKLHKFYGDSFKDIFKSITFDNGSEFSRWKDIEQKPKSKEKRTTVYFGRPYHSCDRASNENCNGLIRYFITKGTDINTIDKETTIDINNKINQKKRKILGYLSSEELFLNELAKLNVTNNTIFYKI
ncbi:IS30 family transposase [Catenibacterium mitsuokai]|uniref:IS30 family transposase n=2 Tax=Catenibacterium mitsuokai TaxID=100886 RepID=UPI0022012D7A|nr:IS30 family transposase [Catenibacterium mitsuokai]UWO53149.1 IS30 family transposase [Catenibacterium mitsuokai]